MNELALFAGAGGGILGGKLLGWKTVCGVENEPYAAAILAKRQNDGILEPFPIWDDVRTFDGKPWKGIVDVVSGGFPCQDISCAGKRTGIEGSRSELWSEMARIICEVRSKYIIVENSSMLTIRGLGRVLGDLAEMGYYAKWGVLGAVNAGGLHDRQRIWIVAYSNSYGWKNVQYRNTNPSIEKRNIFSQRRWYITIKRLGPSFRTILDLQRLFNSTGIRVDDGMAGQLDRLKATGNGQVPAVAKLAWEILST